MARSSSAGLWVGLGLLVVAGAFGVLFLVDEEPPTDATLVAPRVESAREVERRMLLPETPESPPVERSLLPAAAPVDDAAVDEQLTTRSVSGRVVRLADGSPVAGWTIRSARSSGRTGGDGGFLLSDVDSRERVLDLVWESRLVPLPLPDGDGEGEGEGDGEGDLADLTDLELVADTGWIVPGVVLSEAGAPIGDVSIVARGLVPPVTSDSSGSFVLKDVVSRFGGAVATLFGRARFHVEGEEAVRLEGAGHRTAPVEFRLGPAGGLAGRVLMPDGQGAVGHEVRVRLRLTEQRIDGAAASLSTTSSEGGEYVLGGVPAGSWLVLAAGQPELTWPDAGQFAPSDGWVSPVEVRLGETTLLDIQLLQGAVVAGRVTDGSGNPVEGAVVSAVRVQRWAVPGARGSYAGLFGDVRIRIDDSDGGQALLTGASGEATTDAGGFYELAGLPGGELRLTAQAQQRPGWRPLDKTLELTAGQRMDGVDFALGTGLSVAGRVFDAEGRPAAGAYVALVAPQGAAIIASDDRIETDAEGRFRFTGLPVGSSRLYVTYDRHKAQWLSVEAGASELRIDLLSSPLLEGVVLDAFTQEPVTSYSIQIDTETMRMTNSWSAADGRFVIDSLEDEPHTLRIEAPGYDVYEIDGVRPSFGGQALEVLLRPGG